MKFGDKIPFEFDKIIAGVGNAANAAVAAARLGLSSALIANVGKDERGKECEQALESNGCQHEYITGKRQENELPLCPMVRRGTDDFGQA